MSQKCRYCGTPLEGYETFCPGCGRETTADGGAGFRPETGAGDGFLEGASAPAPQPDRPGEARESQRSARREDGPARPAASARSPGRRAERHVGVSEPRRAPGGAARRRPARRAAGSGGARAGRTAPQARRRASAGGRAATGQRALNRRQRTILLSALAVAALLLIALCARMILGGGPSEPVYDFSGVLNTYFESVRTGDADQFISTRPPEYVTYLTTGTGGAYPTQAVYRSETANKLRERLDGYEAEYGDVRSIRYTLTQVSSYVHRCEALSDVLTAWYGFSSRSVSNAAIVSGRYTVQGTKATGEFEFSDLLLIQIGDAWYFSPDAGSYWKAE